MTAASAREPRMTLADATARARTTTCALHVALKSGDLRDLRRTNVDKWIRGRNVSRLARRLGVA